MTLLECILTQFTSIYDVSDLSIVDQRVRLVFSRWWLRRDSITWTHRDLRAAALLHTHPFSYIWRLHPLTSCFATSIPASCEMSKRKRRVQLVTDDAPTPATFNAAAPTPLTSLHTTISVDTKGRARHVTDVVSVSVPAASPSQEDESSSWAQGEGNAFPGPDLLEPEETNNTDHHIAPPAKRARVKTRKAAVRLSIHSSRSIIDK